MPAEVKTWIEVSHRIGTLSAKQHGYAARRNQGETVRPRPSFWISIAMSRACSTGLVFRILAMANPAGSILLPVAWQLSRSRFAGDDHPLINPVDAEGRNET
jgi:hypothetical protein